MTTSIMLAILLLVLSALLPVVCIVSGVRVVTVHYQIVNVGMLEDGGFNEQIRVSAQATSLASHAQARLRIYLL